MTTDKRILIMAVAGTAVVVTAGIARGRATAAPIEHGGAHAGGAARAAPTARAIPEPPAAAARPGQPAATLRPDDLDRPAATALREAARAAKMAAGGHAMSHGTYRQVDAGRDEVVPDSPAGEDRASSAAPASAKTDGTHGGGHPDPHAGHGAAPTPSPTPDPHHMHAAPPPPRPKPSPGTKEQR